MTNKRVKWNRKYNHMLLTAKINIISLDIRFSDRLYVCFRFMHGVCDESQSKIMEQSLINVT